MASDKAQIMLGELETLCRQRSINIVAIDGRCASGKTTLAAEIEAEIKSGRYLQLPRETAVLHMDDFFLRPEQRTAQRLAEIGGNVDYERFRTEVLDPLSRGCAFSYRPYDCHSQSLCDEVRVPKVQLAIVEGAYSCHAALWPFYTRRFFLQIAGEEQEQRLLSRNGRDGYVNFAKKWIPLEERYFADLLERCGREFIYL